jgi:RNA polymerase sigma factor (sigma-70 family)
MKAADSQRLLQHIRRLADGPQCPPSDGELLRRYLEASDQAAFAALLRRHGTMVLAVCQSVLRQRDDAEDAFQAAFLILARKAGSIRRQEGLGGWLQRVAYRVALKARARNVRRQQREAQAASPHSTVSGGEDLSWGEVRAILHAELAALPERFRAPLVLCYLEGLTQEEAAQQLGWTASTVKGRLQRGREKLRRRLERRGIALSAALGAALTAQALAETGVPALPHFTVETATPSAAALARGFGPALASMKGKVVVAVLLAAGLALGGTGMLLPKPAEEGPTTASTGEPAAERPAPRTDLYGDPLPQGAIARMGSLQLRHANQSDFVVLPDNKTILTAGGRVVRFWNLATGKQVREVKLQGSFSPGRSATPSADGKILAGIDQNQLVFWDIDSGKQIKTLPGPENVTWGQLYFSPDGKTLILGTHKPQVLLWDWQKGTNRSIDLPIRQQMWRPDSSFHSCVSPDGKYLAAQAGVLEFLCVYELATGRELHRLPCFASVSTFSADSKQLIASCTAYDKKSNETVIRVFDLANGKEVVQYPLGQEEGYFSLDVSPDGKTLACGFSDRSCLLDLATGRVRHRLPDRPIRLAYSPDGKKLVANMGYHLRVWDADTAKVLLDRPGDFGWTLAMAVSPDGRLLAAADWLDRAVSLWDTRSGQLLRSLPLGGETRYVRNLAFSGDGKTLHAAQFKGFLQFWDAAGGKELRTAQLRDPGQSNPDFVYFRQLHVSADGKRAATLERIIVPRNCTRLALWDVATGKLVSQHELPPGITQCAWLQDGRTAALPLNEGLTLMDVETGAVRYRIAGTRSGSPLAASPSGRLLAAFRETKAKDKAVVGIWEATTGKEVATVAASPVASFALMPDDRHLVLADRGILRVWDLALGKERRRWSLPGVAPSPGGDPALSLEMDAVTLLLLSSDGRRAFTALHDGTALVWDLQPALHHEPLVEKPDDKELSGWWNDLLADDARRAYAALWRLTDAPEAAVPFLRQRLKPATDAEVAAVRRLIADLDSEAFATREKAFEQLVKLGPVAEPALRHALEQKPALEARRRLQLLLERIDQQPAAGESLRLLRALQVLEKTGAEGRRLLHALASGAEGAWLTRAAQAALTRRDHVAAPGMP